MRNFFLIVLITLCSGCVLEDGKNTLVCAAIGAESSIKLRVTSDEPLPENLGVSLNKETAVVEEKCVIDFSARMRFSSDRKILDIVLPLSKNDNQYFPNYAESPQSEYAEFEVYQRSSCRSDKSSLVTRDNIVITWRKVSEISPGCDSKAYNGASEFTYNP